MSRSQLQREIRQEKPFRSRAQEAAIGVLHTADLIRRRLAATVEPFGITHQQYNILRILRGARRPMGVFEIAERLIEQAPGITRHLDLLEQKQLIARERNPNDRRQILCDLTESGTDLLAALDHPMDLADEAVMAGLDERGLRQLVSLLDKVRGRH